MKSTEIGKLPPQSLELEQAIIGAMMIESSCVQSVLDIVSVDSFYHPIHQIIFSAISTIHRESRPIDILTIVQELKAMKKIEECGGVYAITEMTSKVASSAHVEEHARIVQQNFIKRQLITIASKIITEGFDETSDPFDMLESIEKNLTAINQNFSVGKIQSISALWSQIKKHNEVLLNKKGVSGIPSGFENVDRLTGGWQSPDLIIVAARPAMGKTSLAANFARNASVEFKFPGAIFSLEMSAEQIATRFFSLESDIEISRFTRKGIEQSHLLIAERECSRLINAQIFIDDTPSISLSELRSKARKLKREHGIKYVIIDYLQLMTADRGAETKGRNREQEISSISRGLKALAKELEMPVIALSQLNRSVETRGGDKRPQLSDLRESGAIEQDADMVIFLHRPEYYGQDTFDDGSSTQGVAELIFAKYRNGPTGTEKLRFINSLTKFANMDSVQTSALSMPSSYRDFTEATKEPF